MTLNQLDQGQGALAIDQGALASLILRVENPVSLSAQKSEVRNCRVGRAGLKAEARLVR